MRASGAGVSGKAAAAPGRDEPGLLVGLPLAPCGDTFALMAAYGICLRFPACGEAHEGRGGGAIWITTDLAGPA